MGQD
jgi:hypothetical protein